MKLTRGFTVVEIIIVCTVIAILFLLVAVAWEDILYQGEDDTRWAEQQEWVARFDNYKAQFGVYPNAAGMTSQYCLGTGFPNNNCRRISGSGSVAANNTLNDELKKVGTLPEYKHSDVKEFVGPWANYQTAGQIRIYQVYRKACPDGTTRDSTVTTGAFACYIALKK